MLLAKLKERLFGCASIYTVGESVQLQSGPDDLMVVSEIITSPDLKEPLIACRWNVKGGNEVRTSLFPESRLKRFDWNKVRTEKDVVTSCSSDLR